MRGYGDTGSYGKLGTVAGNFDVIRAFGERRAFFVLLHPFET